MTDNLRGSLFMVLAMLGFAIEDMLLKRVATAGMPVGQVLILFGGGGLGFLQPIQFVLMLLELGLGLGGRGAESVGLGLGLAAAGGDVEGPTP